MRKTADNNYSRSNSVCVCGGEIYEEIGRDVNLVGTEEEGDTGYSSYLEF